LNNPRCEPSSRRERKRERERERAAESSRFARVPIANSASCARKPSFRRRILSRSSMTRKPRRRILRRFVCIANCVQHLCASRRSRVHAAIPEQRASAAVASASASVVRVKLDRLNFLAQKELLTAAAGLRVRTDLVNVNARAEGCNSLTYRLYSNSRCTG